MRCFSKSVATSSPQNGPFGFHLPQHEGQDKGRDEVQERDGKGERKRARLQKQMRLRREKRQDGGNDSCRRLGDDPIHCDKDKGDGWSLKDLREQDRKSTRLNSSHVKISYAVFCLKKKKESAMPISNHDALG